MVDNNKLQQWHQGRSLFQLANMGNNHSADPMSMMGTIFDLFYAFGGFNTATATKPISSDGPDTIPPGTYVPPAPSAFAQGTIDYNAELQQAGNLAVSTTVVPDTTELA